MPGLLSWVVTLIRDSEFEASDVFPGPRSSIRHPLSVFPSLDRVQRDQFPGFSGTMKVLRLPPVRPAALRCLRLAVPQRFTRWIRSPADECTAGAWSCSPGVLRPGLAEETTGPPKFLGNPHCPFAHVPFRRRRGCLHQTIHSAAAWPLVSQRQRLPRKVFRRSIAWLSDSLCTLRRTGYPRTTQHSLPVAGQALPDGLSTRRIPMKGFRSASYISSPFPKLCLAQ